MFSTKKVKLLRRGVILEYEMFYSIILTERLFECTLSSWLITLKGSLLLLYDNPENIVHKMGKAKSPSTCSTYKKLIKNKRG